MKKLLNAVKSRDRGTPVKYLAAIAALFSTRPRLVRLSNIAEGTHQSSVGITYEADVAIAERFLLVKRGGAANRVAISGAADTPIGVCSDEAAAAADLVNVRPFNSDDNLVPSCYRVESPKT
jgi:hypothetical protein